MPVALCIGRLAVLRQAAAATAATAACCGAVPALQAHRQSCELLLLLLHTDAAAAAAAPAGAPVSRARPTVQQGDTAVVQAVSAVQVLGSTPSSSFVSSNTYQDMPAAGASLMRLGNKPCTDSTHEHKWNASALTSPCHWLVAQSGALSLSTHAQPLGAIHVSSAASGDHLSLRRQC